MRLKYLKPVDYLTLAGFSFVWGLVGFACGLSTLLVYVAGLVMCVILTEYLIVIRKGEA